MAQNIYESVSASLEIGLSSLGGDRYRVEVRYWPFESDALEPAATGEALLDPDEFVGIAPKEYSKKLTERLFTSPDVRERFLLAQKETYAQGHNPTRLRVRLWFDRGTERLHDLRWELLCEPSQEGASDDWVPLSAKDLVPFSRFLGSWARRPVRLRQKSELRVLVVIASPPVEDPDDHGPAVVNVDEEWKRVKAALTGLQEPMLLANHVDADGPPTRSSLLEALAKESFDIVYIACHGALDRNGPYVLLEPDGAPSPLKPLDSMPGSVLVDAFDGQPQPPRLVVLTACQSAGSGRSTDNSAHLALGPKLVRAGVPAVLAMNGRVSQKTAAEFYAHFFEKLQEHGYVDLAMTSARRTVKGSDCSDWWMPVLYMRLTAGRIWSVLHLITDGADPYYELMTSLKVNQCTPVIGLDLLEPLWGSPRMVAHDWAKNYGFPLSPYRMEELPTVAQYLARRRTGQPVPGFIRAVWLETMKTHLEQKWPDVAAGLGDLRGVPLDQQVAHLASAAGGKMRQADPLDPHRLLAQLPVSIYLTAAPDPLLADALRDANREPIVDYARWTYNLERKRRPFDEKKEFTPEQPLVYHLFGTLDELESLVLTEDNYFDYLIHVAKDPNNTAVPLQVRTAWMFNALMLLGFDLDDWTFRVLYRAILEQRSENPLVPPNQLSAAVQLNPEEDRNLRPELALKYLGQVFGRQQITLSWGQPKDFLHEVWRLLPRESGGPS